MTLPGDGVGPEIVDAAKRVLDAAGEKFGYLLAYEVGVMGGCAIDQFGAPMEDGLIERCQATDAVLLGRRRRAQVGHHRPGQAAPGAGPARHAQGPRALRQPAAGQELRGAGRTTARSSPR